jgi:hypothetical protein
MLASESPPFTIQELQSVPLFAGLRTDALDALVHASRRCQISAGDRFFVQGDPVTTLHVLVQPC